MSLSEDSSGDEMSDEDIVDPKMFSEAALLKQRELSAKAGSETAFSAVSDQVKLKAASLSGDDVLVQESTETFESLLGTLTTDEINPIALLHDKNWYKAAIIQLKKQM